MCMTLPPFPSVCHDTSPPSPKCHAPPPILCHVPRPPVSNMCVCVKNKRVLYPSVSQGGPGPGTPEEEAAWRWSSSRGGVGRVGGSGEGGSGEQQQQQHQQGERDGGKEVVCSLPLPPRIITPPEGQGGLEGVLPREEGREGVLRVKESLPRRPPPHLRLWRGGARPWRSW